MTTLQKLDKNGSLGFFINQLIKRGYGNTRCLGNHPAYEQFQGETIEKKR